MQKGNSQKNIQHTGNKLINTSQILITSDFWEKITQYQEVKKILVLTHSCIFICPFDDEYSPIQQAFNSQSLQKIQFDERFEILKENPAINEQQIKLKGIRFEKQFKTSRIFYSIDPNTISKWKILLKNKMNQINFSNCIRPIRKILSDDFYTLYQAERLEDKMRVIVKGYSKENVCTKQCQKKKLLNEILILRNMQSNNIQTLLQIFQSEMSIYLIFQSKGACLYKIIKSNEQISSNKIKKIISKIFEKMICLHQKGFIHSNIISKNIYITESQNNLQVQIFNYQNAIVSKYQHSVSEKSSCSLESKYTNYLIDCQIKKHGDIVGIGLILKQLLQKQRSQQSSLNIDNILGFQLVHQIFNNSIQCNFSTNDYLQHIYLKQNSQNKDRDYNFDLKKNMIKRLEPQLTQFQKKKIQIQNQIDKIEAKFGTGQKLLVRRKSKFEKKFNSNSPVSQIMIN